MASATVAALMVNTGTPEAARSGAVRHFLRRFLSDPRVIELPRVLWLPLLYGLILPLRAPRSARKYREIWREEGSPLLLNTSRLREALASRRFYTRRLLWLRRSMPCARRGFGA
jgi:ferrochelatase